MFTKSVRLTLALTACALTAGAIPAFAAPIPLTTTTTAAYGSLIVGSTVSGSATAPTGPGVANPFTVSYSESAYRGGSGAMCATCINFVYNFSNTAAAGSNPIERMTTTSFIGYLFSAAYVVPPTPAGGITPGDASYSTLGGIISFNFDSNPVVPGSQSDTLVVFTNATNFQPGTLSFQDGTTVFTPGLMPASATPEPSSLVLLGTGLVGLAGAARRRFKV